MIKVSQFSAKLYGFKTAHKYSNSLFAMMTTLRIFVQILKNVVDSILTIDEAQY